LSDMLLKGSRVSSERICNAGYSFIFKDLESAFYNLIQGGKS
jgi:NAD dependent epimerase/dehydratase family enzyme